MPMVLNILKMLACITLVLTTGLLVARNVEVKQS